MKLIKLFVFFAFLFAFSSSVFAATLCEGENTDPSSKTKWPQVEFKILSEKDNKAQVEIKLGDKTIPAEAELITSGQVKVYSFRSKNGDLLFQAFKTSADPKISINGTQGPALDRKGFKSELKCKEEQARQNNEPQFLQEPVELKAQGHHG